MVKFDDGKNLVKDFDHNDAVHECLYDGSGERLFCLLSKCSINGTEMKNFTVLVLGLNYSQPNPLENLTVTVSGQNSPTTFDVWNQTGE